MNKIIVDEISDQCNTQTLNLVLKITSADIRASGAGYVKSDSYICIKQLNLANIGINANMVMLTSADCKNIRTNAYTFNDIWAIDVSSASDGLVLQIS
jgi:hypothetical protein